MNTPISQLLVYYLTIEGPVKINDKQEILIYESYLLQADSSDRHPSLHEKQIQLTMELFRRNSKVWRSFMTDTCIVRL
jgi:hypothetical protein